MNQTESTTNLPYFIDSKIQTSSLCNISEIWTCLTIDCILQFIISSTFFIFLMVHEIMVHLMMEWHLIFNEMYHVYNQTHHPILKILLLMAM